MANHEPVSNESRARVTITEPLNEDELAAEDANTSLQDSFAGPGLGSRQVSSSGGGGMGSRENSSFMDAESIELQEKLLRPLYVEQAEPTSNEESRCNIVSYMFLFFLNKAMNKATELDERMEPSDLEELIGEDRADRCYEKFSEKWAAEKGSSGGSHWSPVFACLAMTPGLLVRMVIAICFEAAGPFTGVVLLRYIGKYVADPDPPKWHGFVFAAVFFGMQILHTLGAADAYRIMGRLQIRYQNALSMEVMRKASVLSAMGLKQVGGQGVLFQVFQGDVGRIALMTPMIMRSVDLVLQVITAFVYLGIIVGWPVFGALGVFLIVLPFNYRISDSFISVFIQKMIKGDARTQKVIEIVNAVRVVKFYAWEQPFRKLIQKLRVPELEMVSELMKKLAFLMFSFSMAVPLLQLVLFILIVVKTSETMGPTLYFEAMGLTSVLGMAMIRLPFMYSSYLQLDTSLRRLHGILNADERAESNSLVTEGTTGDVLVADAVFSWGMTEENMLKKQQQDAKDAAEKKEAVSEKSKEDMIINTILGCNFVAQKGELVMVVGKVGSGKSSLVSGILGEMTCSAGRVQMCGSIAYAPQQPWILNATVRNNIIVHLEFDQDKYDAVLDAVDLRDDFKALPNGDLTEVGEKGINLSGGQKQRVSLARALYMDADIYIFDDPLSALDAHVGRHVFQSAICGMLADKTRILVTHQLQYLGDATRIYVMDEMVCREEKVPASVPEQPTDGESPLVSMLRAWNSTAGGGSPKAASPGKAASPKDDHKAEEPTKKKKKKTSGQLTIREERHSGAVRTSTLSHYFASFGGVLFWGGTITTNVLVIACNLFATLWMAFWTERRYPELNKEYDSKFFLGIYAAATAVQGVFVLVRELLWRHGAVNAPKRLYDEMFNSVLHAPMSFFDTTPVGRIINRFTKDSEQLDFMVPMAANQVIIMFFSQLGSVVAICVFLWYFIPVAVVLVFVVFVVQPTVATVVLRRLSNATAGPVAALFSEVMSGTVSIRCIGLTSFFTKRFAQCNDMAMTAKFHDVLLFESVRVRINIIMAFVAAGVMMLIMANKDRLTVATASFIITQEIHLIMFVGYFMFQRGNLALALNSVERVMDYGALQPEKAGDADAPQDWPQEGRVELDNVSAQYREKLPLVLKQVSLEIQPGEKIGVCGRTGSGKSSLLLTIFRLVPIMTGSRMLIDGVDTANITLNALRSKLSAIPQEPVLFSGTVRDNIDPFGAQSDEHMLASLEQCHLREALEKLRKDESQAVLDMNIRDGDLSVGQKQLLCLARAISRNMKILVLDEATSSVDAHTDKLIQETIRTVFKDCTVITVAHRLNTIMDSDRVLVLDNGSVLEFDTPKNLMDDENSAFSSLVAETEGGGNGEGELSPQ